MTGCLFAPTIFYVFFIPLAFLVAILGGEDYVGWAVAAALILTVIMFYRMSGEAEPASEQPREYPDSRGPEPGSIDYGGDEGP